MPIATALKDRYNKSVKDELRKQFSYGNVMQIPRVEKVILNIGMGESIGNSKAMDAAAGDLATITGADPAAPGYRINRADQADNLAAGIEAVD